MTLRFSPTRGAGAISLNAFLRGPTGAAATLTAGTATALAAGSTPTVTNVGTSSAAQFNLGIPRGADAGIKWLYDSSTSMADPGSGELRFNNATLSSVTAIAVSATGSGSDVSDFVATWDDSTNTEKGHIVIREEAGAVAAVFALSAVTDNTDWLQLTVTYVSGSLALTAGDPLYVVPLRTGNKGADGSVAGAVGTDDNGVPRADGTGGSTLQGSLVAIDDSGNITPKTTDVGALGTSSLNWADLFLDSGAVINFDSGDVLITHSANLLSFTAASSGYRFDGAVAPTASDGAALGSASLMWADLFLASGGVVNFDNGNYTLTHSAGLLTANGALSIGTSNVLTAGTIELGHASANTLSASGGVLSVEGVAQLSTATGRAQGKETIWVPAAAMWPRTTNGAASVNRELTTGGDIQIRAHGFDTTTEEGVQFYIGMPKSWNKSTITFRVVWTNTAGASTETVSWGLSAGAFTDDDAIDSTDLGTEVRVSDTWLAQNDLHVTDESGAVTVGNTPVNNDMLICQIVRSVANDNMTGDAELLGIWIYPTTNASTDA